MFKALLKKQLNALIYALLGGGKKKSGTKTYIGFAVLFLISLVYIGYFNYTALAPLCLPLNALGLDWIYFAYAVMFSMLITIFSSVFTVQSSVFESKDNDMLLAMPIPPRYLLLSRLIPVYLQGFAFGAVPLLVSFVYYAITIELSVSLGLCWILMLIAVPLFSMLLCTALGTLTAWICSKLARRNIFVLTVSMGFVALYYYLLNTAQRLLNDVLFYGGEVADSIRTYLWPIHRMGRACLGEIIPLLIVLAGTIIIGCLIYFIISLNYIKIMTAKKAVKKPQYQSQALKSASPMKALVGREVKRFFGNAIYLMNAGLGSVFLCLIGVALLINGTEWTSLIFDSFDIGYTVAFFAIIILCSICSMNTVSAPSVALEGKTLWVLQSAPVDAWSVLKAKLSLHLIVTAPFAAFTATVAAILFAPDVLVGIIMVVTPLVFTVFTGCLGLICGLKKPNLEWETVTAAVKQNAAVVISIFGSWAVLFLFILLYFVGISDYITDVLLPYIPFCFFTLTDLFMIMWLKDKGTVIFSEL